MNNSAVEEITHEEIAIAPPHRNRFEGVLRKCIDSMGINLDGEVLVVGSSAEDGKTLQRVGFARITLSNLLDPKPSEQADLDEAKMGIVRVDAEAMDLPDGSYDVVFAHAMLHHCRSPHKALLEMLRVSRGHVILHEPNNSWAMRMLLRLRLSFPYELQAVVASGFRTGGVRDSCIPNYIYRWNAVDVHQTAATYLAEYEFDMYAKGYWDFNVGEADLRMRSQTRIGGLIKILGPRVLLAGLRSFEAVVGRLPWLKEQGNKFFCCIGKRRELKPWLIERDGEIEFNSDYILKKQAR